MKDTLQLAAMRCTQTIDNGVFVISGMAGDGKTLLAAKAALYGLENHSKICVFSNELTEDTLGEKIKAVAKNTVHVHRGTINAHSIDVNANVIDEITQVLQANELDMIILDIVTEDLTDFARGLVAAGKTVVLTRQVVAEAKMKYTG